MRLRFCDKLYDVINKSCTTPCRKECNGHTGKTLHGVSLCVTGTLRCGGVLEREKHELLVEKLCK